MIASSRNDGVTIVPLVADPTSHWLRVSDGTTGVDNGNNLGNAMLDENGVPVLTALSSAADGSIVELYADPLTQALLININ
jgi:hypothetical protein